MINNVAWDTPSIDLFAQVTVLPLSEMFLANDCKMVFKCLNDMVPNYLCRCFNHFNNTINTRQHSNNTLILPQCKTTLFNKSFVPRATKIWNMLDQDLKRCTTFMTFKSKLNNNHILPNLLDQIQYFQISVQFYSFLSYSFLGFQYRLLLLHFHISAYCSMYICIVVLLFLLF